MPAPYAGTLIESEVDDLVLTFGHLVEGAGEVGFILTYHAVNEPGSGRMDLAGTGISQAQLASLLQAALDRNAEHGSTL